jgi:post-segregation antitoxin (ccd killing protein)
LLIFIVLSALLQRYILKAIHNPGTKDWQGNNAVSATAKIHFESNSQQGGDYF